MSVTTDVGIGAKRKESDGLGFYFSDLKWWGLGMALITVVMVAAIWYQQNFGHAYGLDSHTEVFQTYWMSLFYVETITLVMLGAGLWSYLWLTREKTLEITPKEEFRRYISLVLFLCVYTWSVYWAASYFAEQDAAWHQVVTRDTSFTPSHIVIFYLTFPLYIVLGVGSLIWAYTRLPMYRNYGVSLPHVLAVVGPFMIMPNIGLNEWGHAFWFMEELFGAPLHWGFVILGWTALGLGGVLMQIVMRVNELLPQIREEKA
jgi:methane/ammonia monooxygenase subunit C